MAGSVTPKKQFVVAVLYTFPAVSFVVSFIVFPFVLSIVFSLTDWSILSAPAFIGLANFENLVRDASFVRSAMNSYQLILYYSALPVSISLFLSAWLRLFFVRSSLIFRAVLFVPQVLSGTVVGALWIWIYEPEGPLNTLLSMIGLQTLNRSWLGEFETAFMAVGLAAAWVSIGFPFLLLYSAMMNLPDEQIEAAELDGASVFRRLISIIIPGIRREILVAFGVTALGAFHAFDLVFIMTRGGPGTQTLLPGIFIYRAAFQYGELGLASAAGLLLLLLEAPLVIVWVLAGKKR